MKQEDLIKLARQAQDNAYSPYSNFSVGAALLTTSGRVFAGSNVENGSYGLTICAERVAIFKAVSEGETGFDTIAITGSGDGFLYPCGACLQVMSEFAPELKIIVADENNSIREYRLNELLPQAFSFDS
ncbi:cytidine deaminase [Syntrophomonas erecta]